MAELHLSEKQYEIVSCKDIFKVALCGIASGKSYAAACKAVLDLCERRSTICMAQTYAALSETMFPTICSVLETIGLKYYYNKSALEISLYRTNGYYPRILGKSAEKVENTRGLTKFSSLVMDEGALYKDGLYQLKVMLGRLRGESEKKSVLITTTPRGDANWVSNFIKREDVKVFNATMFDNPYTDETYKEMITSTYDKDSDLYKQEVLGMVVGSDLVNAVIRLSDFPKEILSTGDEYWLGVDVARDGVDTSQFYLRDEWSVRDKISIKHGHTDELLAALGRLEDKWGASNILEINVDNTGGWASGFIDVASRTRKNITGYNFAGRNIDDPTMANNRACIYDRCTRAIKAGFYVDEPELIEELRANSWFINASGKRQLVEKGSVRTILGRSPDRADALCLSFANFGSMGSPVHRTDWYAGKSDLLAGLL